MDKILSKVYYDLKSPASYAGVLKILEEARRIEPKIKLSDVNSFLEKQRTYTIHKPIKKKFPRLKTIPSGFHTDWQCDLCSFDQLIRYNDGYKYLLVCIDVLSRMIFAAPAKSKKSEDMIEAFEKVFKKAKAVPMKIYSDSGLEFQANKMKKYFEEKEIIKHVMYSPDLHAGVVERANRTIKERLYRYFTQKGTSRWVDVIDKIIKNTNNSVHRTLGVKPSSVNFTNAAAIRKKIYDQKEGKTPKFKIGDIVRITKEKGKFGKGYLPNFTEELFAISNVLLSDPPAYRIVDLEGDQIMGIFYEQELVRTRV